MNLDAKTRRRWLGGLCLLAAIAMLILESTVLKGRIVGLFALGYWLGCFILIVLAMCAALLDLRAVRSETRKEQKALFESTLQQIAHEKPKPKSSSPKEPSQLESES